LQTLCDESKGKIKWHKFCAIWAFKKPKEWSWGEDKSLIWLVTDNVSKYLGFPINYKMPQKEKDNKILQLIQGNLTIRRSKKLSFASENFGCKPRVYAKSSGSFQVDVELTKVLNMFV
jgi:hypothetical protein